MNSEEFANQVFLRALEKVKKDMNQEEINILIELNDRKQLSDSTAIYEKIIKTISNE